MSPPSIVIPAIPEVGLSREQQAVHALRRLGFGPRPGDVQALLGQGISSWIAGQLHPAGISDERLDGLLEPLSTLSMSIPDLIVEYPPPPLLRGIARRLGSGMGSDSTMDLGSRTSLQAARRGQQALIRELAHGKLLRAIYSERQLQEVMTDFWFNHFNVFMVKGSLPWLTGAFERQAIRPRALGRFRDLLGATAHHPAMLFYLDNWLSTDPRADVSSSRVQSAMSDAARREGMSSGGVIPEIVRRHGGAPPRMPNRMVGLRGNGPQRAGLNENYARELMELHTLGVDGGYTQEDVLEVARALSGWTLLPLPYGHGFVYVDEFHEGGARHLMGETLGNGKERQGEAVLDRLAAHPATARLISAKLARRFVRDDPPDTLVQRMAATFQETDGEIRAVLATLFTSEEFWSAFGEKLKTPLELVASSARASAAVVQSLPGRGDGPGLVEVLHELGQPLYLCRPPTGYEDVEKAWISAGALLNRMKFGLGVAFDRFHGVEVENPPEDALVGLAPELLGQPLPAETLARLEEITPAAERSAGRGRRVALGWLLASPEFQRR